ncbi:unnamed protein product [Pedinophyceae sp. YPF-701]|nr:unnamed protein product [Pedinophyceae sp. YPF-701]
MLRSLRLECACAPRSATSGRSLTYTRSPATRAPKFVGRAHAGAAPLPGSCSTARLRRAAARRRRCVTASASGETVSSSTDLVEQLALEHYLWSSCRVNYSEGLKRCCQTAVELYEVGFSEELLRHQLEAVQSKWEEDPSVVGLRASVPEGVPEAQRPVILGFAASGLDVEACVSMAILVWLTLLALPGKAAAPRLSLKPTAPVDDRSKHTFGGFVEILVRGWNDRRMVWCDLDMVQMELQMGGSGDVTRLDAADYARTVYQTLALKAPGFPSLN